MIWRTFAVGLIGEFVLATLLEIPLQWCLPGRFVDGWASIERGVAIMLLRRTRKQRATKTWPPYFIDVTARQRRRRMS